MARFSEELTNWLESDGPKTLGSLDELFAERSFGVLFLLLLALPATPLPTGGVTHLFELIALVLAGELIVGRKNVWLPARWRRRSVGRPLLEKALPFMVRWVERFEKISRVRGATVLQNRLFLSMLGVVVFVFTLTAFLAPPFSGLDTLPSIGVVLIALSMILEDLALFVIGLIVGAIGVAATLLFGLEAYHLIFHYLRF